MYEYYHYHPRINFDYIFYYRYQSKKNHFLFLILRQFSWLIEVKLYDYIIPRLITSDYTWHLISFSRTSTTISSCSFSRNWKYYYSLCFYTAFIPSVTYVGTYFSKFFTNVNSKEVTNHQHLGYTSRPSIWLEYMKHAFFHVAEIIS